LIPRHAFARSREHFQPPPANPEHGGLLRARAHGLARAGDKVGARTLLQRALQLDPDDRAAQRDLAALDR